MSQSTTKKTDETSRGTFKIVDGGGYAAVTPTSFKVAETDKFIVVTGRVKIPFNPAKDKPLSLAEFIGNTLRGAKVSIASADPEEPLVAYPLEPTAFYTCGDKGGSAAMAAELARANAKASMAEERANTLEARLLAMEELVNSMTKPPLAAKAA